MPVIVFIPVLENAIAGNLLFWEKRSKIILFSRTDFMKRKLMRQFPKDNF
ncbi:hypothetical protein CWATWH8502_338 [Crocosphaera watsonii WH 8502]|uniref:Uncharacterized protein n=5 Tax=Crocosphaera watsonii TaxID=263511 RepID=T2JMI1_CROWT|nr:hypothetical protein CWATWH0003_2158 [Crocosphaera watsonii WH 0003]CCQ52444.1 hypothetical protein CWATWH8502_338 [Crocosphaera watsonii WH 8502]CCQ58174.1 hypothetical protein CWATWH0005_2221 [Crocosphaera watsonii WH 0005]CCQ63909.1 hypothetical protein CWATWH0401_2850 [Crocosphaera watsonii WH 0401]CCQ67073.1 hypothetical protein CWATWH0402_1677 [Crocosphaera watsonii WH 0402]